MTQFSRCTRMQLIFSTNVGIRLLNLAYTLYSLHILTAKTNFKLKCLIKLILKPVMIRENSIILKIAYDTKKCKQNFTKFQCIRLQQFIRRFPRSLCEKRHLEHILLLSYHLIYSSYNETTMGNIFTRKFFEFKLKNMHFKPTNRMYTKNLIWL